MNPQRLYALFGFVLTLLAVTVIVGLCAVAATGQTTRLARDDAPGLQRICNRSNAVITVTPHAYTVASPITLSGVHDTTIFAYGVTLNADARQPVGVRIGDTLRLEHCQHVTVLGLGMNCNRVARGGFNADSYAVHVLSSDDVTFRDCTVTSALCDGAIVWGGLNSPATSICHRVLFDHCDISDPGRNGISFVGAAWSGAINCDLHDVTGSNPACGVDVEGNAGDPPGVLHHITLAGNRAWNLKGGAFYVINTGGQPVGTVIANNQIDGTQWDAIANWGSGTIITGNNVSNCQRAGISNLLPGTMQQSGNNATVYQQ